MGIIKCLERVRFHLQNNESLTEQARDALNEVVAHFEAAIACPGWMEWMEHAVSAPYDIHDDAISIEVKAAWSDSNFLNPNIIAADSLKLLRTRNRAGVSEEDLKHAGEAHAVAKLAAAQEEDEHDKKLHMENKKKTVPITDEDARTAAHAPTSVSKGVINKRSPKKNKEIDPLILRLDEAARNAEQDVKMDLGPPPMPPIVHTQSRSAKLNFAVNEILSCESDKFVIFGDVFELGHLTEALDLVDVKSYVPPSGLGLG